VTAETESRPFGAYLLIAYLALLCYGLGAGLLESFLNYPMWRDMGARMNNADFMATRADHTWRIFPLLVIPLALRAPVTLALFAWRPRFVPGWAVRVAVAAQFIGWVSSVTVQIPIQTALTETGYSNLLFARLIVTDIWFRVLPFVCEGAVGIFLLGRAARELGRVCLPAPTAPPVPISFLLD
jgi:hypothetical protein